jgi:hypothetical protein
MALLNNTFAFHLHPTKPAKQWLETIPVWSENRYIALQYYTLAFFFHATKPAKKKKKKKKKILAG